MGALLPFFPTSGHFGNFGHFDFFGPPDRRRVSAARAHVSEQNFAPFSFHKPRFGHMLQQVHLFILLCLLARSTLSHHTSQSYALTRCCRTVCTLLWPMLTVRNAVTTQHLEKSTFKSAHASLSKCDLSEAYTGPKGVPARHFKASGGCSCLR